MEIHRIIIKQVPNHNVGHVYEHMLSGFIEKNLFAQGFLDEIDYYCNVYIVAGIIVFRFKASDKIIQLIFDLIKTYSPNQNDMKRALQEISNEYFRPYKANFNKLFAKIKQTHNNTWLDWEQLQLTTSVKKSAIGYRSPEIHFLRRNPKLFETFQIEMCVKNLESKLKPLASYVLYFLQINAITHLNRYGFKGQANYCDGYDWNVNPYSNLDDFVGRRVFFTFQKGVIKSQDLQDDVHFQVDWLLKNSLTQKISNFLENMDINNFRLNNDELFDYSGFVAGGKYFKQYATPENIEKIISQIEYNVELEKSK